MLVGVGWRGWGQFLHTRVVSQWFIFGREYSHMALKDYAGCQMTFSSRQDKQTDEISSWVQAYINRKKRCSYWRESASMKYFTGQHLNRYRSPFTIWNRTRSPSRVQPMEDNKEGQIIITLLSHNFACLLYSKLDLWGLGSPARSSNQLYLNRQWKEEGYAYSYAVWYPMSRVLFLYSLVLFIELDTTCISCLFLAQDEQGCDIFSIQRHVE